MLGQSGRIFGVIIIEARFNQKFGHPERLIAKHRDGELAPLDEGFGEQTVELLPGAHRLSRDRRSEEHTSELQSLMRISYAVFCLKNKLISQTTTSLTEIPLIRTIH